MNDGPNSNAWIAEDDVKNALGMTRTQLREHRPGSAEKHGTAIFWPVGDAMGVAFKLGLDPLKIPQKIGAEQGQGAEELTVASEPRPPHGHHFGNPYLIRARRADGQLVVVRVKDSAKYVAVLRSGTRMRLVAKPSTVGTWWELVGREPRWKGVW